MTNYTRSSDREKLNRLFSQPEQKRTKESNLFSTLGKFTQHLMQFLVRSNELRIWQTYDRNGNNWWHAYDPLTGCSTTLESESELRVWIEQRYYQ